MICLSAGVEMAAQNMYRPVQLGINFDFPTPINSFRKSYGKATFFGINGYISAPITRQLPLRAGVMFTHTWLNATRRSVSVTDSLGTIDVTTKVRATHIPLQAFIRLELPPHINAPIRPFASGILGLHVFSNAVRSEIDYNDGYDPEIERDIKIHTTFGYGFELGIHVPIDEKHSIEIHWKRIYGGIATYIEGNTAKIDDDGYANYNLLTSTTDMDVFGFGMVIGLN